MKTLLLILWFAVAPLWAAIPPAEQSLPADTLLMITAPNASSAGVAWTNSNLGKLWSDLAMVPFRTNFEARLQTAYDDGFGKETGLPWADLQSLIRGQLTLAMVQNGWTGKEGDDHVPAWLLILDAGDRSDDLKAKLAAARKKISDAGRPLKSIQIAGIDFSQVVIAPSLKSALSITNKPAPAVPYKPGAKPGTPNKNDDLDDDDDEPHPIEFAFGQVESALVAGTSPLVLEKLIASLRGTNAAPLASQPLYAAARTNALADGTVTAYANLAVVSSSLIPNLSSIFSMLTLLGADPARVPAALGLQSLDYAAISLKSDTNGLAVRVQVAAPEAKRKGLARLLETRLADGSIPPSVPKDVIQFQRWRISGTNIWRTIDGALAQISPQLEGLFTLTVESSAQAMDPNFNLNRDLAANLGDDFIKYVKPPRGNLLTELANPPAVYWIGAARPEALVAGLKGLAALKYMQAGNLGFDTREIAGKKVHLIKLKTQQTAKPAGGKDSAAASNTNDPVLVQIVALTNGVAMSDDAAALDELVLGATNRLSELPETQEGVSAVGGTGQGVFGFTNTREEMRPTWESLRTAGSVDKLMAAGSANLDTVKAVEQWADFKLLPPFEQIARYWTTMVMGGGSNPAGYDFRWFSPAAK
jgi:hypothetical protein